MTPVTTKGFIIAKHLQAAKDKLSDEEFEKLENDLGVSLKQIKIKFFAEYPAELQLAVEERLSPILWGKSYAEAAYEAGRLNFETFSQSAIGKTALLLVGNDPQKMVAATTRLVSMIVSGMDVDTRELSENEFSIRFRNNPFETDGWRGLIEAALERTGVDPDVTTEVHGPQEVEFHVRWT